MGLPRSQSHQANRCKLPEISLGALGQYEAVLSIVKSQHPPPRVLDECAGALSIRFYRFGHTLPISAAIKMICRMRRGATGMTGLCEIVRCSRAAFIFAGNKQQSMTTAIPAAHGAILEIWSPAAIAISAKPVTETQVPAFPIDSGTMRTSSTLRLPQWAEAVSRNIAPSDARRAICQSAK